MRHYQYITAIATVATVGGAIMTSTALAKPAENITSQVNHHPRIWGAANHHVPVTHAELQTMTRKRLDAAVVAGTLSASQEISALNEITAVEKEIELTKLLPQAQQKIALQSIQSKAMSWAKQQGIDSKTILQFMGHHHSMRDGNPPAGK